MDYSLCSLGVFGFFLNGLFSEFMYSEVVPPDSKVDPWPDSGLVYGVVWCVIYCVCLFCRCPSREGEADSGLVYGVVWCVIYCVCLFCRCPSREGEADSGLVYGVVWCVIYCVCLFCRCPSREGEADSWPVWRDPPRSLGITLHQVRFDFQLFSRSLRPPRVGQRQAIPEPKKNFIIRLTFGLCKDAAVLTLGLSKKQDYYLTNIWSSQPTCLFKLSLVPWNRKG